ncbi:MAG: hypothetical protein IJ905_12020, partial [Fibrobacter sp.]|nr:hypothetical protein [Fibrobacter sp.]
MRSSAAPRPQKRYIHKAEGTGEGEKKMNDIISLLQSKKTTDVRRAAKFLQKNLMPELEDLVIKAFQRESLRNQKSWETRCELINCIGINDYKKATPLLEHIAEINEEFD